MSSVVRYPRACRLVPSSVVARPGWGWQPSSPVCRSKGGLDVEGFDEFGGGDELAAVVVEIGAEVLDHRRHGSGRSRAGGFRALFGP